MLAHAVTRRNDGHIPALTRSPLAPLLDAGAGRAPSVGPRPGRKPAKTGGFNDERNHASELACTDGSRIGRGVLCRFWLRRYLASPLYLDPPNQQ